MKRYNWNFKTIVIDFLIDIAGGFFYSAGVYTFAAANHFTTGGISGLAIIANYLWPSLPIGVATLLFNIPLVILGLVKLGHVTVLKTAKTLIVISLITDYIMPHIPLYRGEPLLAALASGVLLGIGIALVFWRGSSTGGADFLTLTLKKRFPHLNIGVIQLTEDAVVLLLSLLVYGNFDAVLYGAVTIVACGKVVDYIMLGFDVGTVMFIVTDHPDAIAKEISDVIDRSSTLIPAKGAYSGLDKTVLMVVIRRNQVAQVKRAVLKHDGTAFVTAVEAKEILGEGFKDPTV